MKLIGCEIDFRFVGDATVQDRTQQLRVYPEEAGAGRPRASTIPIGSDLSSRLRTAALFTFRHKAKSNATALRSIKAGVCSDAAS
ncbi:hypothetical protein MTR72_25130 [Bradyrhizobium sp. ISRA442]|uniref:hypothetical protein n=1 Tax=Bradyrhizobium sp. ISRA442 TaxID=2866197 RepID=UPI00311ADEF7